MVPEWTPAPRITSGSNSGSIATSWGCPRCGHTNLPVVREFFRLPSFICSCCGFKGYGSFSFSFTLLRINGLAVLPPIRNQDRYPICTIMSILNAMEIILRIRAALQNVRITRRLRWRDVMRKYEKALNCEFDGPTQIDKTWGRMKGMLDVVRNIGVLDNGGDLYQITNWDWFHSMSFEESTQILADGVPLLTIVRYFPHFVTLGEHDIYSTRGYPAGAERELHVIVLIGASRSNGTNIFEFVDSHGTHCQVQGKGKVYAEECYMGFGLIVWVPSN